MAQVYRSPTLVAFLEDLTCSTGSTVMCMKKVVKRKRRVAILVGLILAFINQSTVLGCAFPILQS